MDAQFGRRNGTAAGGGRERRVMAGNIIYCLYLRVMLDSP